MGRLRFFMSVLFTWASVFMVIGSAEATSVSNTLTFPYGSTSIAIDASGAFGYSVASTQAGTSSNGVFKYSLDPLQIVSSIANQIEFVGTVVIAPDGISGFVLGNRTNVSSNVCNCILSSSTIYKLNLTTMTIVSSQAFPLYITEISLDSTGQMIYFASGLRISKIDSSDWTESATFTASGDSRFAGFKSLRLDPSTGDVITVFKSASLIGSFVSPTTYELQAFRQDLSGRESLTALGTRPWDMEISSSGSFAIVTDYLDQTVTRIDLDTHETAVINLYHRYGAIAGEYMVAISPDESFALVGGSGFIDRINLETNTRGTLTSLPVGKIVFSSSGSTALGLNVGSAEQKVHLLAVNRLDQQSIENPFMPSEVRVGMGRTGLYATASSGKQVQYFSDTPSICNVAGSNLELIGIGTCTIRASQSGGQGWDAAPAVTGSMNVVRNLITFSKIGNLNLTADSAALQARTDMGSHVALRSDDPSICEIYGGKIHPLKPGRCRITAYEDQLASGIRALEVTQSVWVFPDQEVGISIGAGKNFTNSSNVNLNMVWPDGATSVRISNDGGFTSTNTRSYALDLEIPWVLSGSTSSKSTRVVYARFSGPGIDGTRTYSDDIDLDVIAPRISSVQASSASGKTKLKIRATDNLSKISKLIVNSKKSALGQTVLSYASTVTIKGNKKSLWIRVQDGAGNLSAWRKI